MLFIFEFICVFEFMCVFEVFGEFIGILPPVLPLPVIFEFIIGVFIGMGDDVAIGIGVDMLEFDVK